ncbi:hypothetical protein EYF80_037600 [Liparis tanakae]|uniref:Uncharacterized protein n=1 Tax=Liparis tanakae TaxID=230148 RepID=A0A4Z2GFV7_9TELE|nr:hypothetical protein EYF80_037600 [Liparis tanakae]
MRLRSFVKQVTRSTRAGRLLGGPELACTEEPQFTAEPRGGGGGGERRRRSGREEEEEERGGGEAVCFSAVTSHSGGALSARVSQKDEDDAEGDERRPPGATYNDALDLVLDTCPAQQAPSSPSGSLCVRLQEDEA